MSSQAPNEEILLAEDGPRVLGIGLGLFFLILLWAFTLVAILAFSRYSSATATIICSISTFLTILALALPRFPAFEVAAEAGTVKLQRLYDTPFIWRTILIVLMAIFLIAAFFLFLVKHAVEQIYAEPIRRKSNFPTNRQAT